MFVRLPNVPNVAHNLPLGSRLIRFRNLGSLGGWTLGSTNVEGGLHSSFLVKPNLTRSPKIISCYVHSHRNLYWFRGITSAYGQRCLRFLIQGRAYQFKALPFGLSTTPLEFTVIPKEVNLMAIHKDLRSHQYLDDWLVRARSHQTCLQHTQDLVNNVSATGLAGELREIRAGAQTRL